LWVEKREWALRIHGTIQASLTAALVRLKQPGDLSTLDLALVRQHISQARKGLDQAQPTAFDFAKALRENKKAWQGILNIKSSLRSDAAKLLISDKWASVCANEIIKESLSNSTKHGKADQVEIRFELSQPGFVEIVTQDNGKGLSRSFRPGLGCELISEIAYPWSLTKGQEGGTILRARIPVSGKLIRSKN
jgi:signal transduction histidine kinase